MAATFVDRAVLHVSGGNGGHGCTSVHREKFKPLGGPDGGNGGRGGNVVLVVDPSVTTLLDLHRHPHRHAGNGKPGQGSMRDGAEGEDLLVAVPDGTVVRDSDTGEVLVDLVGGETSYVVARGGRGGLGNAALASARRKAPGFALLGEPGEARDVVLELKSVADVALVGFPNAGKSSLIAAMSAAKPKIADYPFTTLVPNLGVVEAGDTVFTVADVPGPVPGASAGRGLGLEFLRHVERCAVLVHVVDCATLEPDRDPVSDIETIEAELAIYDADQDVAWRPAAARGGQQGRRAGRAELAEMVRGDIEDRWAGRSSRCRPRPMTGCASCGSRWPSGCASGGQPRPRPRRPGSCCGRTPVKEAGFTVEQTGEQSFVVHGERPRRWVLQTDFSNDEAVGYLADRLARLGVEDALADAGCRRRRRGRRSATSTFDWVPTLRASASPVRPARHRRAAGAVGPARCGRPHARNATRARDGARRTRTRTVTRRAPSPTAEAARREGRVVVAGQPGGGLDGDRVDALVDAIAARLAGGTQVVLVSSGAIAAGLDPLGLKNRPRDLATQQAAASVGQGLLVARYTASFARHGRTVGQVLLTADDVVRRAHYRNAQRTFDRLLSLGIVPIVNENDTVATDEIRFGDNDRLAALVTHLVRADALVLLSDVDGVYDDDPGKAGSHAARRRAQRRRRRARPARAHGRGRRRQWRHGDEARGRTHRGRRRRADFCSRTHATQAGAWPAATSARASMPTGRRAPARLLWLAHATTPRGRLQLDAGRSERSSNGVRRSFRQELWRSRVISSPEIRWS